MRIRCYSQSLFITLVETLFSVRIQRRASIFAAQVGYGGLALAAHSRWALRGYALFDLPDVVALASRAYEIEF